MIQNYPRALLYHKVTPRWEVGVTWVTPVAFQRQMEKLAKAGWRTILPDEQGMKTDEHKKFLLIFDDGYECIYRYAFPVLRDFGFKAVVFIPSGYIGLTNEWDHHLLGRRFGHLTLEMLKELTEAGWMIGSHTVSHVDLLRLSDDRLKNEIEGSRRELQDATEQPLNWISYPFGRYDRHIIDAAMRAGYSGAVVPAFRKSVDVPDGFNLIAADAVYRWDTSGMVLNKLKQGGGYRTGRWLRRIVNRFSVGTVVWRRLFPFRNRSKPLAMDG